MRINKPSHDMHQDLNMAAAKLKRMSVSMLGMAVRLSEAGMEGEAIKLLAMARDLGEIEDMTLMYTDEVLEGVIVRASFN